MKNFLGFFILFLSFGAFAQFADPNAKIEDPVRWSYRSEKVTDTEFDLVITATIEKGWHVYSQFIKDGGPIPTSFKFTPSKTYKLKGAVSELPKAVSAFDKNFDMQIAWHKDKVDFRQRIILTVPKTTVSGMLEFMVCNDQKCLPPVEVEFQIPVSAGNQARAILSETGDSSLSRQGGSSTSIQPAAQNIPESKNQAVSAPDTGGSLWG
ncbi:MAG: hypothetical protein H7069_07895, partial [Phormidesmis sp. FL-bin-119]|nr:hypothetical protein [Pedobacter sp.]